MDGLKLLGEIKKQRPRTRVIVISGRDDKYEELAIREGASCFLVKPLMVDSLRAALARP